MRLLRTLLLILAGTYAAIGQTTSDPACFSISGSGHPPKYGEIYKFTLLGPPDFDWTSVKLKWSVIPQLNPTGANTREVSFKWNRSDKHGTITASVEIEGTPGNCAKLITKTMSWDGPADPVKVGIWKLGQDQSPLKQFAADMAIHPDYQGLIFIVRGPGSTEDSLNELKRTAQSYSPQNPVRVTIVEAEGPEELAEIWRVPTGADNPKCESCGKEECPSISILGPAGVIEPGNLANYSLQADSIDGAKTKIVWEVSAGTVEEGLGTSNIAVRTPNDMRGQNLMVNVEIEGLPKNCRSTAFLVSEVRPQTGDPAMLDEFGNLPLREEKRRLDILAKELSKRPGFFLYFILYLEPNETPSSETARIKRISDHLIAKHKIPRGQLVFVHGGRIQRSTKVYLVPPETYRPDR